METKEHRKEHPSVHAQMFHGTVSKSTRRISAENVFAGCKTGENKAFFSSVWNIGKHFEAGGKVIDVQPVLTQQSYLCDLKECLPAKLDGEVPEVLEKKAKEYLGETPEVKEIALERLKTLIQSKKCPFRTDDVFLLPFLRARKFRVENAFEMIENFWKRKKLFCDQSKESMFGFLRSLSVSKASDYRDKEGRLIIFSRADAVDPEKIDLKTMLVSAVTTLLILMEEPANQISGVIWVLDCKGVSLKWLKLFRSTDIFTLKLILMNCIPVRYQQVHILNENSAIHLILKLLEKFLSEKLKKRLYSHGHDVKSLQRAIPVALLPPEYGGTGTHLVLDHPDDFIKCTLLK